MHNETQPPRRPRKTNRCPEWGSRLSVSWTIIPKLEKPLRMSVWPVASHTRTLGRFVWPATAGAAAALTPAQLAMLLEGIDWRAPVRTDRPRIAG